MIKALITRCLVVFLGGWLTYCFVLITIRRDTINPFAIAHEPNLAILITEIFLGLTILSFGIWQLAALRKTRPPQYVQRPNPTSGTFVLIDTKRNIVVGRNKGLYKGVPYDRKPMRYP